MAGKTLAERKGDRKALLDQCVADGWPVTEIMATHGIAQQTINKYYPDYKGMDWDMRNEITGLKRKLYGMLRKRGLMKAGETL